MELNSRKGRLQRNCCCILSICFFLHPPLAISLSYAFYVYEVELFSFHTPWYTAISAQILRTSIIRSNGGIKNMFFRNFFVAVFFARFIWWVCLMKWSLNEMRLKVNYNNYDCEIKKNTPTAERKSVKERNQNRFGASHKRH